MGDRIPNHIEFVRPDVRKSIGFTIGAPFMYAQMNGDISFTD